MMPRIFTTENRKSEVILAKKKDLKPIYGAFVANEDKPCSTFTCKIWSLRELLGLATGK